MTDGTRDMLTGLASAAAIGLSLLSLCTLPGQAWWQLDKYAQLRPLYLVGLLPVVAALLPLRAWKLLGLTLVALLANVMVLAPWFGASAQAAEQPPALTVLYANVLGMNTDPGPLLELVQREDPDLLVLVEVTPRWWSDLQPLLEQYPHHLAEPRPDNFGLAVLSRSPLEDAQVEYVGLPGAAIFPSARASLQVQGRELVLWATHPPPPVSARYAQERDGQLQALAERAAQETAPVLMVGDFNCTPWTPAFEPLLQAGLQPASQRVGRALRAGTWPAGMPAWIRLPLDHALVGPELQVTQHTVGGLIGSDHRPLVVQLAWGDTP